MKCDVIFGLQVHLGVDNTSDHCKLEVQAHCRGLLCVHQTLEQLVHAGEL